MIPKIIHQTCADPKKLDSSIRKNIAFLKKNNPHWEHRLYSDGEVKEFLRSHLPPRDFELLKSLNPKYNVVLADLFRYVAMYVEGGVYLDIKSTAKLPLDTALKPDDAFILSQWPNKLGEEYQGTALYPELARIPGGEFQQWYVVSTPRHPFLKKVINDTLFNCAHYHPAWFGVGKIGVLRLSGPICYTLGIAPLRHLYKHRITTTATLGFEYSIYPRKGNIEFHCRNPDHYSRQTELIFPIGTTG